MPTVLFCADPLNPRGVDPRFRAEAETVRDQGGTVAVADHDALRRGDGEAAVRPVPRDLGPMWYRGWMVTAAEYALLAAALRTRGGDLIVRPDDYARAHELPGWHDTFTGLTPRSVWLPLPPGRPSCRPPAAEALAELVRPLPGGPAVIKDYVKSRKHEWDEACFVPDLRDTAALHRIVARMIALQEEDLYGGLVVREYERYADTGEARVWWIDGEPVLYGPHPDTPDREPEPVPGPAIEAIGSAVRALGCRFITTDLARLADAPPGSGWRVVEVGDGQVSGLPSSTDPAYLFAPFPDPAPFPEPVHPLPPWAPPAG